MVEQQHRNAHCAALQVPGCRAAATAAVTVLPTQDVRLLPLEALTGGCIMGRQGGGAVGSVQCRRGVCSWLQSGNVRDEDEESACGLTSLQRARMSLNRQSFMACCHLRSFFPGGQSQTFMCAHGIMNARAQANWKSGTIFVHCNMQLSTH